MPSMKTTQRITSQAAANRDLIRSVRKALRKRLPTANELVYDTYH